MCARVLCINCVFETVDKEQVNCKHSDRRRRRRRKAEKNYAINVFLWQGHLLYRTFGHSTVINEILSPTQCAIGWNCRWKHSTHSLLFSHFAAPQYVITNYCWPSNFSSWSSDRWKATDNCTETNPKEKVEKKNELWAHSMFSVQFL